MSSICLETEAERQVALSCGPVPEGGWTTELREAASDFGGWEEGNTADIMPAEPGLMQLQAGLGSGSVGSGESGELHIPELEARWQCGHDGVPGSLPP